MSGTQDKGPSRALALLYDETIPHSAPVVVAKGSGATAEAITLTARRHGIPLHEDPALVSLLGQVPLGEEIPESLYLAVAQVLAFAYHLSGRRPRERENDRPDDRADGMVIEP